LVTFCLSEMRSILNPAFSFLKEIYKKEKIVKRLLGKKEKVFKVQRTGETPQKLKVCTHFKVFKTITLKPITRNFFHLGKLTFPILTLGTPFPKLVSPPHSASLAKIANNTASFASGFIFKS
jgi:hypothetical protein